MFKKDKSTGDGTGCGMSNTLTSNPANMNNEINMLYQAARPNYSPVPIGLRIEHMLQGIAEEVHELHYCHTSHIRGPASKAVLKDALDNMQCPEEGCEKCIYRIVGGIEKCDTSKRIADYLIDNDIVSVKIPK